MYANQVKQSCVCVSVCVTSCLHDRLYAFISNKCAFCQITQACSYFGKKVQIQILCNQQTE